MGDTQRPTCADSGLMRQIAKTPGAAVRLLILSGAFLVAAFPHLLPTPSGYKHFVVAWLYDAVMIAAGVVIAARSRTSVRDRLAWRLIGSAVILWGIGDVIWTVSYVDLADPPY